MFGRKGSIQTIFYLQVKPLNQSLGAYEFCSVLFFKILFSFFPDSFFFHFNLMEFIFLCFLVCVNLLELCGFFFFLNL